MSLTINLENKSNLSVTNESKTGQNTTWSEHIETWAEAGPGGETWGAPGTTINRESKNNVTITNESKT